MSRSPVLVNNHESRKCVGEKIADSNIHDIIHDIENAEIVK